MIGTRTGRSRVAATMGLNFYGNSAFIKKYMGGTKKILFLASTFTDSVDCKLELTLSVGWVVVSHSFPALLL